MTVQVRIPAALAAIHNFIMCYDPKEIPLSDDFEYDDPQPGLHVEGLADGPAGPAQRERANARRDQIAADMWESYQEELRVRAEG
jgi:hypothetical protein